MFRASELQHHQVCRVLQDFKEQLGKQRLAEDAVPDRFPAAEARPHYVVISGVPWEPRQQIPGECADLPQLEML